MACVTIGCSRSESEPAAQRQVPAKRTASTPVAPAARAAPAESSRIAGEIFGVPVSMDNYIFAKRVAYMFPPPWGAAELPEADREPVIWESLILHYESFRRGVTAGDDELEELINQLLKNDQKAFTRRGDPAAYQAWVRDTLQQDVELLENQVRYLIQIQKLKDRLRAEQRVSVTEEELQREFLNEKHHVGGEMVVFDDRPQADAFYARVKDPGRWDALKAEEPDRVRPVSLMTLEAYIDLWGVPQEQMDAFHALEIGSVGAPMPFGRQWAVYRLLEKRAGDLKDFPAQREHYVKQLESRKKFEGLKREIDALKRAARLKVLISPGAATPRP